MKKIFILVLLQIIVGCKTEHRKEVQQQSEQKQVEIKEKFNTFLSRFFNDNSFRYSRVNFPLDGYNSDLEMGKRETKWSKDDWEFYSEDDFGYESNTNIKNEVISINEKVKTLRLFKENSGYQIKYEFHNIDGKWYLKYYSYMNI